MTTTAVRGASSLSAGLQPGSIPATSLPARPSNAALAASANGEQRAPLSAGLLFVRRKVRLVGSRGSLTEQLRSFARAVGTLQRSSGIGAPTRKAPPTDGVT